MKSTDTIFLFDVDGTLTKSRQKISADMKTALKELRKKVYIGFVGGSDLAKQEEQIGADCLELFDVCFPENGVAFFKEGQLISQEGIIKFLGEEKYKRFVNFNLRYLADLDIPIKRGTFLELRSSMINICPIGRNCSLKERMDFFELDKKMRIRKKMVEVLQNEFGADGLQFSIGGQISIDCFPHGWDKTYCLNHLKDFKNIIFFGDMTMEGGNDYEIFNDSRTEGITVTSPEDTFEKIDEMLEKLHLN